jgi:nicotinate-nucleotide adenylyltransferase
VSALQRLGLFGGSFDPIHAGHLHVARAACAAFDLDQLVFVPAARPPHKPGRVLAAGADRLAMVDLAIAGEARWSSSDIELKRSGPSYTIDTLRALPAALGVAPDAELFLVIGSDNLPGLPGWRDARELLSFAQPIVVLRAGDEAHFDGIRDLDLEPALLERLERGLLRLPPAAGRSTELREGIQAGAAPGEEVPARVREYITVKGLYQARP